MAEKTRTEKLRESLSKMIAPYMRTEMYRTKEEIAYEEMKGVLKVCREAGLSFVEIVNPPSLQDPGGRYLSNSTRNRNIAMEQQQGEGNRNGCNMVLRVIA